MSRIQADNVALANDNPRSPKWNAIVSLIVDNMDHYGNLVTYVRLNGMVPPTTAARGAGRGGQGRGGPGGAPGGPGGPGAAPAPAPAPKM